MLCKKSPSTKALLCFMRHEQMENWRGLAFQGDLSHADGCTERRTALEMLRRHLSESNRQPDLGCREEIRCGRIHRRSSLSVRYLEHRQECAVFSKSRRPNPLKRLCTVSEARRTDRGKVWLGQDRMRYIRGHLSRRRTGEIALHSDARRKKSSPAAPMAGGMRLYAEATSLLSADGS